MAHRRQVSLRHQGDAEAGTGEQHSFIALTRCVCVCVALYSAESQQTHAERQLELRAADKVSSP